MDTNEHESEGRSNDGFASSLTFWRVDLPKENRDFRPGFIRVYSCPFVVNYRVPIERCEVCEWRGMMPIF